MTTILLGAFGGEEIAAALGIKPQTFKQTRTRGVGRRNPPNDWEAMLLPLVERLGDELAKKAPRRTASPVAPPSRPAPFTKEAQTRRRKAKP